MCQKRFHRLFLLALCCCIHLLLACTQGLAEKNRFPDERAYDVIAIGDAINNFFVECRDSSTCNRMMQKIELKHGGFKRIDSKQKQKLDDTIQKHKTSIKIIKHVGVASASNTIRVVEKLGGKTAFISNIGEDKNGRAIKKKLTQLGIKSFIKTHHFDTAAVYIFRDAAGEKAMASYLGGPTLFTKESIALEEIAKAKIFLVEGYAWQKPKNSLDTIKHAVIFAKSKGIKTALSLANSSVIRQYHHDIYKMLEYFDLVFGTKDEFIELLNQGIPTDDSSVIAMAQKTGNLSVITMGKKGAFIVHGPNVYTIPAEAVKKVVCTVGAGDAFAGGFLYGYTRNFDLAKCGKIASHVASKIVQKVGTTLD
ncbi:MAG: adenosine kinase [Alphaproteobacteria bacterium]